MTSMIKVFLICCLVTASASACARREGPMERAGKKVDRGVDNARDAVEDAGDAIEDATDRRH